MKRILMLGLVLALLATMIISSAAFACGAGDGTEARNGTTAQYGAGNGAGDGTGPIQKCLDLNGDDLCGKP
jgi:hypothetical protein